MADGYISQIKTPDNKVYLLKDSESVHRDSELLTTNPFAPASLRGPYISKIDNAFYAANKRWQITATNLSYGGVEALFDGNYESQARISGTDAAVITMDFDPEHTNVAEKNKYFPGYPYGYILISFYSPAGPTSISGRVYCNYGAHGIGWHNLTFSPISDNTAYNIVYRSDHQGYYNMAVLEITINGNTSNSYGYTAITQIEMHLDRPNSKLAPFLSKYGDETLYYNLTAPKFIGALQGNADTTTKFNSTRKIELTGAVTGSATTDGSSGWTISTTVNHNHDSIYSYIHLTDYDFTDTQPLSKYVTFDKSRPVGAPKEEWYNGFISSHGNYHASYIINGHTNQNEWYVGHGIWREANTPHAPAPTWYLLAHSGNVGTGDNNGQVKIAGQNVSVKGLKALAYKDSLVASDIPDIGDAYLKLSGGTMTGDIKGNASVALGTTTNPFHHIVLGGSVSNTLTADSTNPRITFQESNNGTQPVHLIYSDYDSYRSPAGLKIIGGTSASPAWLEVEGNIYAAAFKGHADSATSANYINLYETRGNTTTLNKVANYIGAGKMFHLVASSSTDATDNGKTPTDANILQMNWDNSGGYDAQLGIATSANRMYFRSRSSQKIAWDEVAHAPVGAGVGSVTQPVYMTSEGVITAGTALKALAYKDSLTSSDIPDNAANTTGNAATATNAANTQSNYGAKSFIVEGNADTYYPVIISGYTSHGAWTLLNISRDYAEQAPDTWNTSTHKGGLVLTILSNGDRAWGGNHAIGIAKLNTILDLSQQYCTMVGDIQCTNFGLVIWLRGGSAKYWVTSNGGQSVSVTTYYEEHTQSSNTVAPRSDINTNHINSYRWNNLWGISKANISSTKWGITYYSDTNGTFAGTGAGTSGQYLKSNGNSAPTWATFSNATVGLGNVENTKLSTWAGSSNITTVGTISTGTWHGTKIANDYIANPKITIAGNDVNLGSSLTAATLTSSLGLSNALHFIGITSTTLADESTTATLTPKSTNSLSKTAGFVDGDVVMDGDQLREYVWSGDAWRLLGITTSTVYTQPASTAANTWIAQISQGTDGKITATTGSLDTSGTWSGNAATATAANLTSTANAVAYYTNTAGKFGSKASANGALYATSANGALQWGTLPIAQGGTGVTSFTKNQVILSDNTNGTTGLTSRAYSDSTSAGALSNSSTNFVTERDVYFGLPTLNNAHNYTSSSTYYAPTAGGTAGHILIGAGATTAPAWYGGTVMSGSAAASWITAFNGTTDATATNAAAVTIAGGLGISKKLYVGSTATVPDLTIGSTNEYGDAYTPIYWHEGVPTAVTLTQQCAFTINSGKSGVKLSHAAITANSYVTQIVVTSGEANLNSAISWTSADGYIELTCSSTVSGDVTGYIMISRGGEITATATDIT